MKKCAYCGTVPPVRKVGSHVVVTRHDAPCGLPCWHGVHSEPGEHDAPPEIHGAPTKIGSGKHLCPKCGPVEDVR